MDVTAATRPLPQLLLLLWLTLLMGAAADDPESDSILPPATTPDGQPQRPVDTLDERSFTVLVLAMTGDTTQQCSGSILSKHWVITAAHCVNSVANATDEVVVGVGRTLDEMESYAVDDVFVHGKFNVLNDDFDYNVALLKLTLELPLSKDGLHAVRLPAATTPPPRPGLRCVAAGWASRVMDVYMAAETKPELHSIDCFLDTCALGGEDDDGDDRNTKICLSARDDCRTEILSSGDAGGPLVCGGVLAGVLSHARPARPVVAASEDGSGSGGGGGAGTGWCVPRGPRGEGGWRPLAESAAQSLWALWGDVREALWGRAEARGWRPASSRPSDRPSGLARLRRPRPLKHAHLRLAAALRH